MWIPKPRGIRSRRVSPCNSQFDLMLDRYTEIERENRILLEKMTTIMSQKPKVPEYSSRSIVFPNPSSHRQYV
jgi:hypothetical protein